MDSKILYFGKIKELSSDKFVIKNIDGINVGAAKINNNYKVILNVCPHAAAEVCKGIIRDLIFSNTVGEFLINENNQTLVCPWHRWEFDLNTGKSVVKSKLKIRIFETFVENENLYFKK
jgi:nitrite reductase/ring-hydroxylating ferredoxin subunit